MYAIIVSKANALQKQASDKFDKAAAMAKQEDAQILNDRGNSSKHASRAVSTNKSKPLTQVARDQRGPWG